MIDVPNNNLQVKCFIGAPQTGRTNALVQEAVRRAGEGASVLFVCAREHDAQRIRQLVDAPRSGSVTTGNIRIMTCADVAQDILGSSEAQMMFGRGPRLLEPYEEAVLLEDLKVSQMKNRRLRKVLAYLRAGWSNLSDDSWEQTAEEDLVIDRMRANLQFTGGALRCEASNLALHALREHEALRQRASYDYVFVDDFELLSRASQHLVRMLASRGLVVASGEYPSLAGDEECPCFEGLSELLAAFPAAQVVRFCESKQAPAVRHIVQGLLTDQALSPLAADMSQGDSSGGNAANGDRSSALRMLPSLETELQALAIAANDALERGETVLIVGTNRLWRRNVAANLRRVGLPAQEMRAASLRLKDFQNEKQCARARRDAAARLAADSADDVAWRTLIALGDGVARSAAVDYLRRAVEDERGRGGAPIRLHEALELLEAGEVVGDELTTPLFDDLLAAYRDAKASVAACGFSRAGVETAPCEVSSYDTRARSGVIASGCGFGAFPEGAAPGSEASGKEAGGGKAPHSEVNVCLGGIAPGCEAAGREEDPRRGDVARRDASSFGSATPEPVIWIVSPEQAAGLRFDTVLFGGFVNGLIPCRAYCDPVGMADESRQREHAKDVRTVYGVASCARKQLLFTGFSTCGLQAAETMDVHIESIKLRKGMRIVITQPSELANLLG